MDNKDSNDMGERLKKLLQDKGLLAEDPLIVKEATSKEGSDLSSEEVLLSAHKAVDNSSSIVLVGTSANGYGNHVNIGHVRKQDKRIMLRLLTEAIRSLEEGG